jgi:hypothetical protein
MRALFASSCALLGALLLGANESRGEEAAGPCIPEQVNLKTLEELENAAGGPRIAVLYRELDVGDPYLAAVREACLEHIESSRLTPYLFALPYDDEDGGLELLGKINTDEIAELILGPTDSGIFEKAISRFGPDLNVPVVSPLVITEKGNERGGWFFGINVGVDGRAAAIYDALHRAGYDSIGVLHAGTGYGKAATEAFAKIADAKDYFALSYGDDTRPAVRALLDRRPSGVGIFGSRDEIQDIARDIERMQSRWNSYDPRLFTVVDAREANIEGLQIVALDSGRSDVIGLAYDATRLVLGVADSIRGGARSENWRGAFRRKLEARLSDPGTPAWSRTHMRFSGLKNKANVNVFAVWKPTAKTTEAPEFALEAVKTPEVDGLRWLHSSLRDIVIVKRRFGWAWVWNGALIAAVVTILSHIDLRRWHRVSLAVMQQWPFRLLVSTNVVVAVSVFFVFSLMDWIRPDQPLEALAIAFGYSALLKSAFFQSAEGKAFGIARYYDMLIRHLRDRIMLAEYEEQENKINYIAYANTLSYMRRTLEGVFEFADPERAEELRQELQREIGEAQGTLSRRRACARMALEWMTWDQLQNKNIVPGDAFEEDVLTDPEALIHLAVDHCTQTGRITVEAVEKLVIIRLGQIRSEQRGKEMEAELQEDLGDAVTEQGRFGTLLRWLLVQYGFQPGKLAADGLLPEDFERQLRGDRRPDRRSFQREKVDSAAATLRVGGNGEGTEDSLNGRLVDVSEGGARVAVIAVAAPELVAGTPVLVEVQGETPGPFAVQGRVVFRRPDYEVATLGICFDAVDDTTRDCIARFVEREPPVTPPAA